MNQSITLFEELKRIFLYRDRFDKTIISLYDLSSLIKEQNINYNKLISKNFKTIINNHDTDINMYIHSIDYNNNEIIFTLEYSNQYQISCKKENQKLLITYLNKMPNFIINKINNQKISSLYNKIMKYKDYIEEEYYRIPLSNSSFLINITNQGISIYKEQDDKKEFILSSYIFKDEYILQTNTESIKSIITNNEDILLKNTFIKIENCPKWSQEKLYNLRKNQITKNNLYKIRKLKKES